MTTCSRRRGLGYADASNTSAVKQSHRLLTLAKTFAANHQETNIILPPPKKKTNDNKLGYPRMELN